MARGVKLPAYTTAGFAGGRRGGGGSQRQPQSLVDLRVQSPRGRRGAVPYTALGRPLQAAANIQAASARNASDWLNPALRTARVIGEQERQKELARRAAEDKLALAQAVSAFTIADVQAQAGFEGDPDYGTYTERYGEQMTAAQERILEGLPEHLRPHLQADMAVKLARGEVALTKMARDQWGDSTRASLVEMGESSLQAALNAKDPASSSAAMRSYYDALTAAAESGAITQEERAKQGREWVERYAGVKIGAWFREQPDPHAAGEQILSGEIDDPTVRNLWGVLSEEARTQIFNDAAARESKLAALKNRQDQEIEEAAKAGDLELLKGFYFGDMTSEEQYDTFEALKKSPHVSIAVLSAMEDRLQEGPTMEDNEIHVTAASLDINSGAIRSADQLVEEVVDYGWQMTPETFRKLDKQIIAMQDKRFLAAMRFGTATLGVPQAGLLGDIFAGKVDKVAQFQADMHNYKFEHPEGQFMDFARKWVADDEKTPDTGALTAMPIMTQRYRTALTAGDPDEISAARSALITIMVESNQVTAQEASRAGFDPLSIIDAPNAPTP